MLCVATSSGHLIFYNLVVLTEISSLYTQQDSDNPSLKRDSDELYFKENVPPLVFSQAYEVSVPGGVTDIACIRDELMVATANGHILRYLWDGQISRDYCLDLRRIPFCVDQQVLRAVPLVDSCHVKCLSYSPLLGGFSIVLSDGRAACLVSSSLKFDPNGVQGVWAGGVEDVTTTAINHKYRLMAFGRKNSHGIVFCIDESTGGLELSHRLALPTRDYPGCPGPVTCMKWTPDSTCLALVWAAGGFSVWSTFGTMIFCNLGWDHGPRISDAVRKSPYNIQDLDWSAEGYQLWCVNGEQRQYTGEKDKEFCPFPDMSDQDSEPPDYRSHLSDNILIVPFVKSPLSVNPAMAGHAASCQLYLQGEDRLYLNLGEDTGSASVTSLESSTSKQWTVVTIPHTYISSSWPIRYTASDEAGHWVAVAGRTGLAYYNVQSHKWTLFGNQTQEKDFIVTGGMLWWRHLLVIGCFNISANRDEVRFYTRDTRLENSNMVLEEVEGQVLLINRLGDRLVVYCATSHISIYQLDFETAATVPTVTKVQDVDACALSVHPACVVSIMLTHLRTETGRQRSGDANSSSPPPDDSASLIMNVSGRLVLIQRDNVDTGYQTDRPLYSPPTVLAGSCEQVWLPSHCDTSKPHLTHALWLYCGAAGMRVWLPLFPRVGETSHSFMARRIMLHFPCQNIYPLRILFEKALMLGVANETQIYPETSSSSPTSLPLCTLERVSEVYLHQLLRQLIRRNLGQHAWDIASSCSKLPYFQHSLELLLHSVLEEEATSKEPIPDALLPSIVDFIRSFPIYRETVVRCTRKTEIALWQYLFAAVGSPRDLFSECLKNGELNTAASYLIVLQSLEPSSISRQYATQLLDAALDAAMWKLAKDLIRFLKAIDPDECEDVTSPRISQILPPFSSPLSPPHAEDEDLSLVLGTLVGPRNRSISVNQSAVKENHSSLSRSASEKSTGKQKRLSTGSSHNNSGNSSAEEFFIDVIFSRHARKLLTAGHLIKLGVFFAQFPDFQAVSWLRKEKDRAGQIHDFCWAVKKIHDEFGWRWPSGSSEARSRAESVQSGSGSRLVEDNLKQLYIDTRHGQQGDSSGYISDTARPERHSQSSLLTVDAMLRIKEAQDGGSVLSDDADLGSVSGLQSPIVATIQSEDTCPIPRVNNVRDTIVTKTEAKLTYLLHMLLEADCLDWAGCIALVLQDVMAVIRIINSAKSNPDDTGARLFHGFHKLNDTYHQYVQFLTCLKPHMTCLAPTTTSNSPPRLNDVSHLTRKSVSPVSRPDLSRSMSDPGARDYEEVIDNNDNVNPKSKTPSPRLKKETIANVIKKENEVVEEEEAGCILM